MDPELEGIVQRMVEAGESEDDIALVIREYRAPAAEPEAAAGPSFADVAIPFPLNLARSNVRQSLGEQAPAIAGTLASLATGGLGAIPAMAATGGASGGVKLIQDLLAGKGAGEAGQAALASAASEGVGRGAGKALSLAGRGLYRAGALPLNQIFGKYGDVVKKGLDKGVLASEGGLKKATDLRNAASAQKAAGLAAADQGVTLAPQQIADDMVGRVQETARLARDAGEPDPSKFFAARAERFAQQHPGGLSPSRADQIKQSIDNKTGLAWRKRRDREPLTPIEEIRLAQTESLGGALEGTVPGYRGMNREIMDTEGLRRMIHRRVKGSGGNQGLENALTMMAGVKALPARLLMLPPVATGAGIAADRLGKASPIYTQMLRAALLAALDNPDEQQDTRTLQP